MEGAISGDAAVVWVWDRVTDSGECMTSRRCRNGKRCGVPSFNNTKTIGSVKICMYACGSVVEMGMIVSSQRSSLAKIVATSEKTVKGHL